MTRKRTEQPALWPEGRRFRRGPVSRALGSTVQAMRDAGQLEKVDDLTVTALRALCGVADAALADPDESRFTVARVWSELGNWHDRLRALSPTTDDDLDRLLDELSGALGDTQDG